MVLLEMSWWSKLNRLFLVKAVFGLIDGRSTKAFSSGYHRGTLICNLRDFNYTGVLPIVVLSRKYLVVINDSTQQNLSGDLTKSDRHRNVTRGGLL